jgi:hypothetical protein
MITWNTCLFTPLLALTLAVMIAYRFGIPISLRLFGSTCTATDLVIQTQLAQYEISYHQTLVQKPVITELVTTMCKSGVMLQDRANHETDTHSHLVRF